MKDRTGNSLSLAEASTLRENVRTAMKGQTDATVQTAKLLFNVCYGTVRQGTEDVQLVIAWGHDNFDLFAEDELGMHMTTARGLVYMYEELYMRRDFPAGYYPDSITKLRQLTRVSKKVRNEMQFKTWVGKAKEMSCCDFEMAVEEEFGEGRKFKRLGFSLKLSHYTTMLRRLRVARESFDVASNGEALNKIVEEWSDLHERTDRVRKRKSA